MKTTAPILFDVTYEVGFDGELGAVVSVDAHSHLDFADAEIFLADTVARELYDAGLDDGPIFGLEIEHLWRVEHPLDIDEDDCAEDRWTYSYTEHQRPGAIAVTRFQIAHPWSRPAVAPDAPRAERNRRTGQFTVEGVDYFPLMCINHPDEPAQCALDQDRFIDPAPEDLVDGNIHYCRHCYDDYNVRVRAAREKALAPTRTRAFLDICDEDIIGRAFGFPLRRDHLVAVLERTDFDGSGRRALTAFADAYRAAALDHTLPVAVGNPGWRVLLLTDIVHLVADYGA